MKWLDVGIGFALGLAAYWLYDNREAIGFAVAHRDNIASASHLVDDIKGTFSGVL